MLTIERARVDDIDSIRRVLSETWLDTYGSCLSPSTIERVTTHWHDANLLRSQIEEPGNYFAVARDGGRIVGLITVVGATPEELYLPRLYVHPEHQRRGIGSALLDAAIAAHPDAAVIRLAVERRNAKGLAYWRKQRFVETGTAEERIGTESMTVLTMERRLR